MFRTEKTVGMLKSIALIAGLAILLWSLGLPSLRFADAASLTEVKDTISDSAPSASANHDLEFTHPASGSGVPNGEDIVITFPGGFDLTGIAEEDIDILVDGSNFTNTNWSVVNGGSDLTITIGTGSIGAGSSTQILIGLNATNEGSPDTQITNPSSEGSYEITVAAGTASPDTGATRVVILSSVEVTASVDTVFTFAVAAVGPGVSVNGETTTGSSSSTTIPFGTLTAGGATTTAQQLSVSTNASNGYTVTVQTDGPLESSAGGVIDGFQDGSDLDDPSAWASPSPNINQPETWGHWGFTSDDADIPSLASNFAANEFVAASTSPRAVMEHDGPSNGTGTGVGTTFVAYKVEISSLQEAGDDYSTTLTYIATPTF